MDALCHKSNIPGSLYKADGNVREQCKINLSSSKCIFKNLEEERFIVPYRRVRQKEWIEMYNGPKTKRNIFPFDIHLLRSWDTDIGFNGNTLHIYYQK